MHGTQTGDPAPAAAIEAALAAERPPLRLRLGTDAVDQVRAHAQALLMDVAKREADALLEAAS